MPLSLILRYKLMYFPAKTVRGQIKRSQKRVLKEGDKLMSLEKIVLPTPTIKRMPHKLFHYKAIAGGNLMYLFRAARLNSP